MSLVALCCVLIGGVLEQSASAASTTPNGPGRGQLYGKTDRGVLPLPLISTQVSAHIAGSVASVTVKQQFRNPNAKPLEAIYVFPLPDGAAVHHMNLRAHDKVIKGEVKPRTEVQAIYEMAKKAGKTVARLDQERPNIFTQSIANIFPKSNIEVELRFDVQLALVDGFYAFEFPMVVGSRYIPGDPNGKPSEGWGENPDTDRVPDASKITPPVASPGERSGRSITLELTLEPGSRIRELFSPTHTIKTTRLPRLSKHATRVELASKHEIPNKDFVVRYQLAGERPSLGLVSHMDARGGFFALRFEPPAKAVASDTATKELVFVIDTSESMGGESMERVKEAMRYAVANMEPSDTFRLISFASGVSLLGDAPLANTAANRERALEIIDGLVASGGAETLAAVRLALDERRSSERLRVVTFLSNGLIGNEREVLAEVTRRLGDNTRLFSFGVGAAPNRFLLERMAELGRGMAQFMLPAEPSKKQIETFYARVRAPVLTHIEIDWKGLGVEDVRPRRIPDLFVGRPLAVVGRFARSGKATIEVRGRMGGRRVVYEVPVVLGERGRAPAIARVWARAKVRELELESLGGAKHGDELERLGVAFQIVTRRTSFVALAEDAKVAAGDLQTIMVPVDAVDGAPTHTGPTTKTVDDKAVASEAPVETPNTENKSENKPDVSEPKSGSTDASKQKAEDRRLKAKKDAEKEEKRKARERLSRDEDRNVEDAGDDDDDDADDGVAGAGDTGSDLGEDDEPAPVAPRVALDSPSSGGAAEFESSISVARSRVLGGRWRLGVALGLGSTSGAAAGESQFATSVTLTIDRVVASRIAVGAGIGLLVRGPETDRLIGNVLVTAGYLDLLGAASQRFRLELSGGVGPSVGSDSLGLGVMGALKLRIPIPVALQLRYDGALRFGDDTTVNTVTGGFEFSF